MQADASIEKIMIHMLSRRQVRKRSMKSLFIARVACGVLRILKPHSTPPHACLLRGS